MFYKEILSKIHKMMSELPKTMSKLTKNNVRNYKYLFLCTLTLAVSLEFKQFHAFTAFGFFIINLQIHRDILQKNEITQK